MEHYQTRLTLLESRKAAAIEESLAANIDDGSNHIISASIAIVGSLIFLLSFLAGDVGMVVAIVGASIALVARLLITFVRERLLSVGS